MPDNKEFVGGQDRKRVNINERYEVDYWTRKWNISEEQLRSAVQRAGVEVDAIARVLGK